MANFTAQFVRDCALCFRSNTPHLDSSSRWSCQHVHGETSPSPDRITGLHPTWPDISAHPGHRSPPDENAAPGLTMEEMVDAFISHVYRLHGSPDTIISGRGAQFVADFWRRLCARLQTALHPSSAFHPQTDGQTEIVNASVNKYLRAFTSFTQDDWVDLLPVAEFAMNN